MQETSSRLFFIADHHFWHSNILKYEPERFAWEGVDSIASMNAYLVRRWNETVCPNDTVWHLGDVMLGGKGVEELASLVGRKFLVMGNHDRHRSVSFWKRVGFEEVYRDSVEVPVAGGRILLLSHAAVPELPERVIANIHGHSHRLEFAVMIFVMKTWWLLQVLQ